MMSSSAFVVRRATEVDAAGIVAVLTAVTAERIYSAIDRPWTVDEQRRYLRELSAREAFHIGVDDSARVVGYQTLDLYSTVLSSMAHVAQLGTFVAADWRGRGVGVALFRETEAFARAASYRKIVIQVRGSNAPAQAFYRGLGFEACGRLTRQVVIDDREDDEIIFERFL